jgi:hypothetical protein
MIPLKRTEDYFKSQLGINISKGSISNFNEQAAKKLDWFKDWAKNRLKIIDHLGLDSTGPLDEFFTALIAWLTHCCQSSTPLPSALLFFLVGFGYLLGGYFCQLPGKTT